MNLTMQVGTSEGKLLQTELRHGRHITGRSAGEVFKRGTGKKIQLRICVKEARQCKTKKRLYTPLLEIIE